VVATIKVVVTLVFLAVTNTHANLPARLDQLIHNFDGYTGALVFIGLWIFCIAGLVETAFLSRTWLRLLFGLPIIAATLVGFSYERVAGVEINYDSLAILLEAVAHVGDALVFHAAQITIAAAVCLVGFLALVFPPGIGPESSGQRPTRLARLHPRLQPVAAAAPFVLILGLALVRGGYGTAGLPIQHKVASLFLMIEASERFAPRVERNAVELPLDPERQDPTHVVLIFEESLRGDYIDLNNERGTTPRLLTYRDSIVNFGRASSGSNCSAGSNLIIRTGARPESLREMLGTNPYLWSYASRAGFRTVYIEAQAGEGRLHNRMSLHEQSLIDEFIYADGDSRLERDLAALEVLNRRLQSDTPHFIYFLKAGLHFPFEDSYPPSAARFRPHMQSGYVVRDRELLVNSYKNAVSWAIDSFLEQLFETADLDNAVLVYTSDHGQNLLDNGRELTHCSTVEPSPYEGLVPILVATRRAEWRAEFEGTAQRNAHRTSHFNLFPTLLVLFGYEREPVRARYGASLLDPITERYGFVSGIVSEYRLSLGPRGRLEMNLIPEGILRGTAER
jgi:hypothetical protein